MQDNIILSMEGITKKFYNVTALENVNIKLKEKEILALVGENGAGKSTLMKILSGTYPSGSYNGSIYINGEKQRFMSSKNAEEAGIAMIYQEINLELDLSIAENIMLGMLPKTPLGLIDWKKVNAQAEQVLKRLKVDIDVTIPVRNLSASLQQLICIARALIRNPYILILDEPTSTLTEAETVNLMEILRDLKTQGISCIYISHKLEEVFDISDRVAVLRDGKLVSIYEKNLFNPKKIVEDMIGRKIEVLYPKAEKVIGEEVFRVEGFTVPHPYAPNKALLENVGFSIRKGEILGLAGLVGAGRSELLKAIFGAMPKAGGRVYIEGKEVYIKEPSDAIYYGLGLLTEDRKNDGLVGTMNIKENMTLPILKKISNRSFIDFSQEEKLAMKYFETLDIKAPDLGTNILTLSGGNQQKVILAKWLLTDLRILFLDEPTRGIDVGTKAEIYKLISALAAEGLSIVMISSELPELLAMCDRFVVLAKGRVQAEIDGKDATQKNIMNAAAGY